MMLSRYTLILAMSLPFCSNGFAFDCIIRPIGDDARLARDTGEKIIPKLAMYKNCQQLRVVGKVEVFYQDANAREKMILVSDTRVDAVIAPVELQISSQDRSLLRSIGAILLGQERYRTGAVRSEEEFTAAEVLPLGKVLERANPVVLRIGFLQSSPTMRLRIYANSTLVFESKELRSFSLPPSAFKAGVSYQWRLSNAQGESSGSYRVVSRSELDAKLGLALVSPSNTLASLAAADSLRAADFIWDARLWLAEQLSKSP